MARMIDPRVARQLQEGPPAPEPERGPSPGVQEPILPEANAGAKSLRGWGNGTLLMAFLTGLLLLAGAFLDYTDGAKTPLPAETERGAGANLRVSGLGQRGKPFRPPKS
jgi:hypothetical protein